MTDHLCEGDRVVKTVFSYKDVISIGIRGTVVKPPLDRAGFYVEWDDFGVLATYYKAVKKIHPLALLAETAE